MKIPLFLTIGDDVFFNTIFISAKQLAKFYPNAKLYIYDWGISDANKKTLVDVGNTVILRWNQKKLNITTVEYANLIQRVKIFYHTRKRQTNISQNDRELNFLNKLYCLIDFNEKYKENFIYLDGDAFLINKIDEILTSNIEIGATLRRDYEIDFTYGRCAVINAGVIFFLGGYNNNRLFLQEWEKQASKTKEYIIEQTALTRLLEKNAPSHSYFKPNNIITLPLGKSKISVILLPCEVYNFNWTEEKYDINTTKILHLKSNRKLNKEMLRMIGN